MTRTSVRTTFLLLVAFLALGAAQLSAHCQIPCGIYSDEAQFDIMLEDVRTIEKAMNMINQLGADEKPNWNQLVRWVQNKEDHADKLTETVTYYFLTQRIKPVDGKDEAAAKKYMHELTLLHHIMVHAMKAKQTTELEQVAKLRELIDAFKTSYLGEHQH